MPVTGLNVGSVYASIGGDTKPFQGALKTMHSQGVAWSKTLTKRLTAPITALGTGLVALQKSTGNYADQLLDLEEITGISTTSLQEFRNVARVAGVEQDALANVVSGLSRRMSGIISGTGNASDA